MRKVLLAALCFSFSLTAFAVTVTVTSPTNNQQVSSPVHLAASAKSNYLITGWVVYLDGNIAFQIGATNSIDTSINAANGSHQLVFRAWDQTGAYGTVTEQITVTSSKGVTVNVSSPKNGDQIPSPFNLVANATSSYQIVGWAVYLDGNTVYSAGATSSINTSINAAQGGHQLVVRAWDASGAFGDVTEQITITGGGGGDGLPDPPPGAIVFNNIDQMSGWKSCHDPGCAGGSGKGSYWMAQNQSSPSRDGSSMEFFNSGVWANALWWKHLGANNNVRNFLWDFYFYLDSRSSAQALEFDAFQFVSGYNYMIGTQCVVPAGVWDTWDEASGHWIHTSIPCTSLTPGTWHHVQWYMTTDTNAKTYTYVTLVVDGHSTPVKITRNAKYLGWASNVGVQWQLDVNGSGQGYHEWVDSAKLTIW